MSRITALLAAMMCASTVATASDESLTNNWLLAKYDLNGDARITQKEIISKKRHIFRQLDNDNNGGISFNEYESMDITKREALLKSRFNKLDLDQSGTITEHEYCTYMGLFNSIDSDGDGALTSKEMDTKEVGMTQANTNNTRCLLWFCIRTALD